MVVVCVVIMVVEVVMVVEEVDGADAKAIRFGREDTGTTVVFSMMLWDEEVGVVEVDGVIRILIFCIRCCLRVDIICCRVFKCIIFRNILCRRKCRNEIKFFLL